VTPPCEEPLIAALLDPGAVARLAPRALNDVLLRAQRCGLLARLEWRLRQRGQLEGLPLKARDHLEAARIGAESTQTAVRFEVNRVRRALGDRDVPIVLLKGAAYLLADLPPAHGRTVGDLDVLVPRERIDEVERVLVEEGWAVAALDPYDQRYYREWTHEIPPLEHPQRETPLDIHHTIAPLTSRVRPDAAALLAAAEPLATAPLRVLSPPDMVLHSAVHLFNDEVGKPLRDLFDIDGLLRHFGGREGFWDELVVRARLHGLGRPLHYALRHASRILGTPVPPATLAAVAEWAPAAPLGTLMDRLFTQYFVPESPERPRRAAAIARAMLYLRAHWLRMPPAMLLRHLAVKAVRRLRDRLARKPREDDDDR
jgi:hypothetical protein